MIATRFRVLSFYQHLRIKNKIPASYLRYILAPLAPAYNRPMIIIFIEGAPPDSALPAVNIARKTRVVSDIPQVSPSGRIATI